MRGKPVTIKLRVNKIKTAKNLLIEIIFYFKKKCIVKPGFELRIFVSRYRIIENNPYGKDAIWFKIFKKLLKRTQAKI